MSYTVSEVRGIKISAISGDGSIAIKEVIVDVNNKPLSKNTTKAFERTRMAKLPAYIFDLIKEQETYKTAKLTGEDGYLITMDGKAIYRKFIRLQKEKEIPHTRFHDLRHLNASVMLQLNIPDKYAMERGGWATDHVLKGVYQHTFSNQRKAVDKKVDAYFGKIVKMKKVQE